MKKTFTVILALALLVGGIVISGPRVAHAAFGNADFLKANGTVIRNNSGTGSVVNLHGTNLGGWLLREGWMAPLGEAALSRSGWTVSASSTEAGGSPYNAIDGNLGTRWSTGAAQANGQWFKIDLGSNRAFDQISFDAGSNTGDYPAGYLIQVSSDGANWSNVASGQGNQQNMVISVTQQNARYILIFQTGSKGNWWSIAELNVYQSDEYTVRQTLTNRFGSATADSLTDGYQDTWIQASDLDNIKNIGLNVVRVPIYWQVLMNLDGSMKSDAVAFRKLDWLVSQSAQRNLYVILDLHGTPGADCPWQSCGQAGSNQLWSNSTYQNWTVQIWQRLASHYNGNPTIAGYDLLNEPLLTNGGGESSQQVQQKYDFYNRLYQAVRAIDPNHIVIVEAFFGWGQALQPSTYGWTNVVYQLHYYNFSAYNDWTSTNNLINNSLQDIATFQANWNVPVYAGEYWFWQFNDLWGKWLSGLNALNVSWTNWAYKNKNSDSSVGPDGIPNGGNWGFYTSNTNPVPDVNNDSSSTIASKLSQFGTNNFVANTSLQNLVRTYTQTPGWSSIRANANNTFVSADNFGNNPLIANRPTVGAWEEFKVVNNPDGTVSLLAMVNSKYVSADLNQSGKLIAESRGVLGWEEFRMVAVGNGAVTFQSVANNMYVSADLNNGGVLIANRTTASTWEQFVISPV